MEQPRTPSTKHAPYRLLLASERERAGLSLPMMSLRSGIGAEYPQVEEGKRAPTHSQMMSIRQALDTERTPESLLCLRWGDYPALVSAVTTACAFVQKVARAIEAEPDLRRRFTHGLRSTQTVDGRWGEAISYVATPLWGWEERGGPHRLLYLLDVELMVGHPSSASLYSSLGIDPEERASIQRARGALSTAMRSLEVWQDFEDAMADARMVTNPKTLRGLLTHWHPQVRGTVVSNPFLDESARAHALLAEPFLEGMADFLPEVMP